MGFFIYIGLGCNYGCKRILGIRPHSLGDLGHSPNLVLVHPCHMKILRLVVTAWVLGLTWLGAAANPSTAILLLRADGPNAKRMQARMVNDLTVVRTKKSGLRTSFTCLRRK